jgi:hypothetical protein
VGLPPRLVGAPGRALDVGQGLGIARAFGEHGAPEALRLGLVPALLGKLGEVAEGEMSVATLIRAGELLGTAKGETATPSVSRLAREHQVSRKLLFQQVQTAERALQQAFSPAPVEDEVLFHLPVTKTWLQQLVLSLVLTCHSSYRGVVDLLSDLLDVPISVVTLYNIVHGAVAQAHRINQQYDLSQIRIGAHDEIYQAGVSVLVRVDTASTFCYLLSSEEHCDADIWGVRLLELVDRGFAPQATIGDGGRALRCGEEQALPATPCRGDHFHLIRRFEAVATYLEHQAYRAIAACQ